MKSRSAAVSVVSPLPQRPFRAHDPDQLPLSRETLILVSLPAACRSRDRMPPLRGAPRRSARCVRGSCRPFIARSLSRSTGSGSSRISLDPWALEERHRCVVPDDRHIDHRGQAAPASSRRLRTRSRGRPRRDSAIATIGRRDVSLREEQRPARTSSTARRVASACSRRRGESYDTTRLDRFRTFCYGSTVFDTVIL